ncbi:hypothetical protein PAXRUDRAFT_176061, partial [Paxillus rubicundulus Ve08.2h10]
NIELLLHKWQTGKMYWKQLDDDEFSRLHQEWLENIDKVEISDCCCRTRSDKGYKKRKHIADPAEDNDDSNCSKRAYKSTRMIPDEVDDEGESASR